jgi:hypothetical protein
LPPKIPERLLDSLGELDRMWISAIIRLQDWRRFLRSQKNFIVVKIKKLFI